MVQAEQHEPRNFGALEGTVIPLLSVAGIVLVLLLVWTTANDVSPEAELYFVSKILFWAFTAGVVFLPTRWALLSLMLVMQIDVVAPGFVGAASVGWENAIKALVLPALMFWRLAPDGWRRAIWTRSSYLWTAFAGYVALAAIWSPYKLAAAKMVAYLLCYLVLFWLFYWAWRGLLIDAKVVLLALWGSLGLACLQTFALGNPMNPLEPGRFTSFSWPQEFAPWLVSALAILLFYQGPLRFRGVTVVACVVGIVMTGSRFSFIGLACLLFVVWLRRAPQFTMASLLKSLATTVVILAILSAGILYFAPSSRLTQLLLFGTSPEFQSVSDIGTFWGRLVTDEAVVAEVSNAGASRKLFGAGTSTGSDVILKYGLVSMEGLAHEDYVDSNRAVNSDFFRALYEWGIIGTILGCVLFARLVAWSWKLAARRSAAGFALLGLLPAILLSLVTENALADASSPLAIGFLLVLVWGFAESRPSERSPLLAGGARAMTFSRIRFRSEFPC
jgi:hypothetical protein